MAGEGLCQGLLVSHSVTTSILLVYSSRASPQSCELHCFLVTCALVVHLIG